MMRQFSYVLGAQHITLNILISSFDKLCLNINQNYCAIHDLIGVWRVVSNFFNGFVQA